MGSALPIFDRGLKKPQPALGWMTIPHTAHVLTMAHVSSICSIQVFSVYGHISMYTSNTYIIYIIYSMLHYVIIMCMILLHKHMIYYYHNPIRYKKPTHNRRKFRSQTSDNMDRWKAETGRVREKRRVEERTSEKRKSQKKEDPGARKGRKVAKQCVFPMIWCSGGSKSRLAKAAGAEPAGRMRCRKSARRCGAKHTSKSKCTKHLSFGALLEVEMSKKCTLLWREAHFEVNKHKAHQARTTFGSWDVEKAHAVVARSKFRSQNDKSITCSRHFWTLKCRFAWQAQGIVHRV